MGDLKLAVGGEECEDMEEFEEKAKEGFEAIGPVEEVEKDLDLEDI